ncbi:MAG: hypothetical protein J6J13_05695 [Clostridia bacterium]|nr:hypothetical protein [Clostridia bacterium]MBP3706720.1 hypothetical protein [Clostridia bacterium]
MNSILSFIISFCVITVILGTLYILCPKGALEKSVKYIFVLLLVSSLAALIKYVGNIEFNPIKQQNTYSSDQMSVLGARLTFEQALKNAQIDFSKITVCTDKTEDGSIIISEVIVYSAHPHEDIIKIIGNDSEYEVTVVNE